MSKDLHQDICSKGIFAKIYDTHADALYRFLYYKYGEDLLPADRAQDAFIKLWENCGKIPPSKAKSFLYTTANNMMLNAVKHKKVVLSYQKLPQKNHSNESPEFIYEHEEFALQYQKALSKLSEEQRVAFLLNKVEGKKHQDIAEQLGVTKKVVEYRIYTAFKLLKEELSALRIL